MPGPDYPHHLPLPRPRHLQMVLQQRQLPRAAHKGTLDSGASPQNPRLSLQEPCTAYTARAQVAPPA